MTVSNPFAALLRAPPRPAVERCRACERLTAWREAQRGTVPPRFATWVGEHGFWGRPVPSFGDACAWLAIVGLAPAAQGANRTGRMFTGDRSGDFLFAALHRAGLADRPVSLHRDDGLELHGALLTAPVRCAPPANRPTSAEIERCRAYLAHDLARLERLVVVLALGRLAHASVLALLREAAPDDRSRRPFRHGAAWELPGGAWLVDSYHVSQQNTFTGRLTVEMFDAVLARCAALAST
jgi:uracil-DNA glycosylase